LHYIFINFQNLLYLMVLCHTHEDKQHITREFHMKFENCSTGQIKLSVSVVASITTIGIVCRFTGSETTGNKGTAVI